MEVFYPSCRERTDCFSIDFLELEDGWIVWIAEDANCGCMSAVKEGEREGIQNLEGDTFNKQLKDETERDTKQTHTNIVWRLDLIHCSQGP